MRVFVCPPVFLLAAVQLVLLPGISRHPPPLERESYPVVLLLL